LVRRFIYQWPPRSPNLNPCDFYVWGMLKDEVMSTVYTKKTK